VENVNRIVEIDVMLGAIDLVLGPIRHTLRLMKPLFHPLCA